MKQKIKEPASTLTVPYHSQNTLLFSEKPENKVLIEYTGSRNLVVNNQNKSLSLDCETIIICPIIMPPLLCALMPGAGKWSQQLLKQGGCYDWSPTVIRKRKVQRDVCSLREHTATDHSWQFFVNQSSRLERSLASYFHFV